MRKSALFTAIVAALVAAPVAVYASHQFDDVPPSHTFHNSIGWMADNGITVGCNPPDNDQYCPQDSVNRGQMSAFMKRLAENRVVDAGTLDGIDSTEFIPVITRLLYKESVTDDSISFDYEEMREVGTFTKERDDTVILLNWGSHASVDGVFCDFQLRVDGASDGGNTGTGVDGANSAGKAVLYTEDAPFNVMALFPDLSAGEHTISIWVRGSGTSCTLNPFNFSPTVIVEETLRAVGSGSTFSVQGEQSTDSGE